MLTILKESKNIMLFRSKGKPQVVVHVPDDETSTTTPKAVVILLGWFGSKLRHVQKYAQVYEQQQHGCATITAVLDNRSLMVIDAYKIDELAVLVAREANKLLRQYNGNVPLICHVFSNGGAIPLQRFEQIMLKKTGEKSKSKDDNDNDDDNNDDVDWHLLRKCYQRGAQIFDSAPAFPDMETFQGAVNAALPNRFLGTILFWMVALFYRTRKWVDEYLRGVTTWDIGYWQHWETCPNDLVAVQAFVYSTADTITKASKLNALVATRRKVVRDDAAVLVKRFDDSGHVQHMIQHKQEYCGLMEEVLQRCCDAPK